MQLLAYVDESRSDPKQDPDTYLMAAAVLDISQCAAVRSAMAGLRLNGPKLHWHTESEGRRRRITRAVADCPGLEHIVVVRAGVPGERDERQRRKCLERLLIELVACGVESACLESRGRRQDLRDVEMLQTMRAGQALRGPIRLEHAAGPTEPLLWVADAVAGVVVAARLGVPEHRRQLDSRITEHRVEA